MDRSEVDRKSFSIWSFICYVVLENPVYYLVSIYWALLYIRHSKHFIMVVRKLLFVV